MSARVEAVKANLDRIGALEWVRKQCNVDVDLDDLLGTSRLPSVIRVRHDVWRVVRDTFGYSYSEMARLFAVDHTTVIHAIRKREAA